ncbi:MAG: hypothetical protein VKK80_10980 [Prochlorothrix sp.]|nr:hypothetical protein [Prochlorothrix sp.]
MEIKSEDYQARYEPTEGRVEIFGILRLSGLPEYQPIMDLLLQAVEAHSKLTVDLSKLEFLNSSGISMLSMFVVQVRGKGTIDLTIQGSSQIFWQTKSLKNLQRLMPSLILQID